MNAEVGLFSVSVIACLQQLITTIERDLFAACIRGFENRTLRGNAFAVERLLCSTSQHSCSE